MLVPEEKEKTGQRPEDVIQRARQARAHIAALPGHRCGPARPAQRWV